MEYICTKCEARVTDLTTNYRYRLNGEFSICPACKTKNYASEVLDDERK